MFDINILAVVLGAVASMVVGGLWYSPLLFLKKWMALLEIDPACLTADKKPPMGKAYTLTFLSTLVASFGLNALMSGVGIESVSGGAVAGAFVWLAFSVTTTLPSFVFSHKPKPWALFAIDNSMHLVSLVINGIVIAALM